MKKNKIFICFILFAFTSIFIISSVLYESQKIVDTNKETWISIFNGEDLEGWTPKFTGHELGENFKNTFRVEDGLLKVSYENYDTFDGKFGHLFYKDSFSKYKIRLEYRFVGDQIAGAPDWAYRNSGIKFHGQTPESMGLDQQSPVSIEVQLLGGDGKNERPTANMCSMGTHVEIDGELITQHCLDSISETFHGDQWVKVEAEILGGDMMNHYVNGRKVLTYGSPQYDTSDPNTEQLIPDNNNLIITEGSISLQAESHPVHFRNIEIMLLD